MSRHTDYHAGVALGGFQLAPRRIDLTNFDGAVLATTRSELVTAEIIPWKVTAGDLTFTQNTVSQRSLSLTVTGDDERLIPFPGSALHPDSQNRVRIYDGIVLANGSELSRPVATMLIDGADATESAGVVMIELDLVDLLHPVRSDLEHSFDLIGGELVSAAVARLLAQVLPDGSFLVEDSGYTIPSTSTLTPGTNRLATVTQLLLGCGQELVTSEEGLVYVREIPSSDDDPNMERWIYGPGQIPVTKIRRSFVSRTAQAWKIEGGNFTSGSSGQTIVVYDRDPKSEGYWRPEATHHHIGSTRLPWVGGVRQAAVAAYAQIRAHSTGPGVVELTVPPNPLLKEGDLIELESGALKATGLYRVVGYNRPEGVAMMSITARKVFDPSLGYEFPVDRGEGCILTASDSFGRGDGPLDNPLGTAGLDWVPFGLGWRISSGRAVQVAEGWGGAVLNTPMCTLDQSASVKIVSAEGGVGPLVRSSGEFDGYAATVDAAGEVRLEVWLNGRPVATLGSASTTGDPGGRTLALTAVGSSLSVEYGSDTILFATDDRRTGTHVGIVGQQFALLDDFAASEAT